MTQNFRTFVLTAFLLAAPAFGCEVGTMIETSMGTVDYSDPNANYTTCQLYLTAEPKMSVSVNHVYHGVGITDNRTLSNAFNPDPAGKSFSGIASAPFVTLRAQENMDVTLVLPRIPVTKDYWANLLIFPGSDLGNALKLLPRKVTLRNGGAGGTKPFDYLLFSSEGLDAKVRDSASAQQFIHWAFESCGNQYVAVRH